MTMPVDEHQFSAGDRVEVCAGPARGRRGYIRAMFESPSRVEVYVHLDGNRGFDVYLGHEVMLLPREVQP